MSFIQRLLTAILPRSWAEDMQAESRSWMVQCACGFERSIWEAGGIRWKAIGRPRRLIKCPQCGERTWHTVYRRAEQS
jgi:hypothetical protein